MSDISNSTNWSETDASNDILGGPGWPGGMDANQVEPNNRGMMGAIRRAWDRINPQQSSGGSAGAFTWTPANVSYPASYAQGERFTFKANFTSVGADTLNVNGLGAKPIYKMTGSGLVAIVAGDIQTAGMYDAAYDSALNSGGGGFQLLSPATTSSVIPAGVIMGTGASAAPAGWALCNGAAISRTGNPALFAAIGTTFGAGDGSTTFNVPDGRARTLAGMDPSNATGRLTASASGGVSAAALGNVGGEQAHALVTAELAVHNHGVSDPTHIHGVGDPGHGHGVSDPTHAHSIADPGHGHGVSDPGHNHGQDVYLAGISGGGFYDDSGASPIPFDVAYEVNTLVSGTGVAIQGSGTGIGIFGAATGIGIQGSGTGVFLGFAATGISTQNAGSGSGHNTVQPTLIVNYIIKL